MISITAVIRTRSGEEETMRRALLDVARHVPEAEPGTRAFFVSQDTGDGRMFTTYERFTDQAAMDRHNGSAAVMRFFATAKQILDGEVVLHIGREVSSTP